MTATWQSFDNILSELWKFFGAPLLNFVFICTLCFPLVTLTAELGTQASVATAQGNEISCSVTEPTQPATGTIFQKTATSLYCNFLNDPLAETIEATTSFVVSLGILVFLLHVGTQWLGRLVMLSSTQAMPNLRFSERLHRIIDRAPTPLQTQLRSHFETLGASEFNNAGESKLQHTHLYAVVANDRREGLERYRNQSAGLADQIGNLRLYSQYSMAYLVLWVLTFVAIIFIPETSVGVTIFVFHFIALAAAILLYVFARRAYNRCAAQAVLLDLDVYLVNSELDTRAAA